MRKDKLQSQQCWKRKKTRGIIIRRGICILTCNEKGKKNTRSSTQHIFSADKKRAVKGENYYYQEARKGGRQSVKRETEKVINVYSIINALPCILVLWQCAFANLQPNTCLKDKNVKDLRSELRDVSMMIALKMHDRILKLSKSFNEARISWPKLQYFTLTTIFFLSDKNSCFFH